MKKNTQTYLANKAGISDAFLSEILAGKKAPSWETAKKLAKFSSLPVSLWMESKNKHTELKRTLENHIGGK